MHWALCYNQVVGHARARHGRRPGALSPDFMGSGHDHIEQPVGIHCSNSPWGGSALSHPTARRAGS
ncbi:MAG: hypothetical protein IPH04_14985 [Saprospirales bacterium]|nr:hypothetical protein [Saprospirales bacterium]